MEKNAIMRLNELPCNVTYKFQAPDEGSPPSGEVGFRCVVELIDRVFEDKGATKKVAKLNAAVVAVTALQASGILMILERQQAALKSTKRKHRAQFHFGAHNSPNTGLGKRIRKNPALPKNAVMKLNDHHRALKYDVISYGSREARATVKVMVCGKEYTGSGLTKRIAKQEAAEQALRGLGLWTAEDDQVKTVAAQTDPTSTKTPNSDASNPSLLNSSNNNSSSNPCDDGTTTSGSSVTDGQSDDPQGKTPVMLLHELYRDQIVFTVGEPTGQTPNVTFDCALQVAGHTFNGSGSSKKAARQAAAAAAVAALRTSGELNQRERDAQAVRSQKRFNTPDRSPKKQYQQQQQMTTMSETAARPGKQPPLPKNSIMRLNDKFRSLPYTVVSGSDAGGWVTMTVVVEGVTYSGQGPTKKQAKLSTAEAALRGLGNWTAADENVKRMLAAAEASKPSPSTYGGAGLGRNRGRGRGGRGGRGGGSLRGAAVASAGRWVRGGVVNYTGGTWTSGSKDSGSGYSSGYGNNYQGNGNTQGQHTDNGNTSFAYSGYNQSYGSTPGVSKSRGRGASGGQFSTGKTSYLGQDVTGYGEAPQDTSAYNYGQLAGDGSYSTGAYQSGYGQGSYEGATGGYGAGSQW